MLIVIVAGCLAMLLSVARPKEDNTPLHGAVLSAEPGVAAMLLYA